MVPARFDPSLDGLCMDIDPLIILRNRNMRAGGKGRYPIKNDLSISVFLTILDDILGFYDAKNPPKNLI